MGTVFFNKNIMPVVERLVRHQTEAFIPEVDVLTCGLFGLVKRLDEEIFIRCNDYCITLDRCYMITRIEHNGDLQFPKY